MTVGCALARFLLDHVVPAGPVLLVGDDTVDGHPGRTVYGKGRHRGAVRSSHAYTAWRYGHKWVVLAVLVKFPFAARRWARPVLVDLYRTPEVSTAEGVRHRTPARLMCRLLRLPAVAQRVPESSSWRVRYASTPRAAKIGGCFELRFGTPETNSSCVVIRILSDARPGRMLRVAGICPDGSDLLIRLKIRAPAPPDVLGLVMSLCPACEARTKQAVRAEQTRNERHAVQREEQLKRIGVVIGVSLFILMGILLWLFFG